MLKIKTITLINSVLLLLMIILVNYEFLRIKTILDVFLIPLFTINCGVYIKIIKDEKNRNK